MVYKAYDFSYPDGPHDAETLLVDGDGRLFIVTKGAEGGIYAAPSSPSRQGVNELERVGDAPAFVTDGTVLPDGRFALRTYVSVEIVDPDSYEVVARAATPAQKQGESITTTFDGKAPADRQRGQALEGAADRHPDRSRRGADLFERGATGNLRELTIQVAKNPAMLYFLDAQYNVKGAANENFAREVMELFTMGVGNYSEKDVRECARAFTGWYFDDLAFKVDPAKHDNGPKTFLGRTGDFDGDAVLKIIFEQPVTAEYLAGKIYRFLVRDELSPELRRKLGAVLREHDYEVKPLLTVIFSSRDFYSQASYGGHIKGPVEHLVAMMKHLGADSCPACPTSTRRRSRWASTC